MQKQNTIGILGGMGPESTNRLAQLITELTPAVTDQSHIPVITYNNSAIPSRLEAIFENGPSPLSELIRTARVLEQAGADFILMPCNTAHYYFEDVQRAVKIPVFNMIEETVRRASVEYPDVTQIGLLSSTPTLQCGLYHKALAAYDKTVVVPDDDVQNDLVSEAIFGPRGIKAGNHEMPRRMLMDAAEHLVEKGAQLIIAGCTEVSLVLKGSDVTVDWLDPLEVLARMAIEQVLVLEMTFLACARMTQLSEESDRHYEERDRAALARLGIASLSAFPSSAEL